jgi:hypothetical protein
VREEPCLRWLQIGKDEAAIKLKEWLLTRGVVPERSCGELDLMRSMRG